jgi:hypothetical protein
LTNAARRRILGAVSTLTLLVALPLSALPASCAPQKGWGTGVPIEQDDIDSAVFPRVGTDGNGNAFAVWQQDSGTNIWANRFSSATGWGTAEPIETDHSGPTYRPDIGVDRTGGAVAVWYRAVSDGLQIIANRYVAGSGWGVPEGIDANNSEQTSPPEVAVDDQGDAWVVWHETDWTNYTVWTNRYAVGAGWGTAELLSAANVTEATNPRVASNGAGDAFAVWHQGPGVRGRIAASRYVSGQGWSNPEILDTGAQDLAYSPNIAVDPNGNAIAAWVQRNLSSNASVWASRYSPATGMARHS